MKIVIQRSKGSSVIVDGKVVGQISKGMVVFVCLEKGDNQETISKAIHKIINIRMFEDPLTGKMSHNLQQFGGEILSVSQFTLSWEGTNGHRPSFDNSMEPISAKELYNIFLAQLAVSAGKVIADGEFGAQMEVKIINDGPVTFFFKF